MQRSKAYFILERFWATATDEEREALGIAQRDIQFVDLMPKDMVHVVRCKDCIMHIYGDNVDYICGRTGACVRFEDFCSYGEKKEAEGDG